MLIDREGSLAFGDEHAAVLEVIAQRVDADGAGLAQAAIALSGIPEHSLIEELGAGRQAQTSGSRAGIPR